MEANRIQDLFFTGRFWQLQCLEEYYPQLQEIHLRVNAPICVKIKGREYGITNEGKLTSQLPYGIRMQQADLQECLSHICRSSIYAYEDEIRRGYITMEGGHRIGLAGQAVLDEKNDIKTLKYISFLTIRIAHEVKNAADPVLAYLYDTEKTQEILYPDAGGQIKNTLIISPPGFGKTTLLRDILRQISNGNRYGSGKNCSVIDERSEIAGSYKGIPQLEVGMRTDVLDACPKAEGMMMVIRSMAPQVMAVDELGNEKDIQALFAVMHCGCSILATIHGDNLEAVRGKSFLRKVMDERVFARYFVIENSGHRIAVYDKEFHKI